MPKVVPFKACRPTRDKAGLVGSRSFIEYSEADLNDKLINNPYTFLHVIYPDFGTPGYKPNMAEERFLRVREKFEEFLHNGVFMRDQEPVMYIYRQIKGEHTFTGVIAGVSVADYENGNIKVHEHTITAREEMFKEYLKQTSINAEPVLLAHPDNDSIDRILEKVTGTRAEYEFTTTDTATHYLWLVESAEDLKTLQEAYTQMNAFYIADGHHRSASSALLAKDFSENNSAQYFMCYLLPESQMHILPFHRFVKGLNGYTPATFPNALSNKFIVSPSDTPVEPSSVHEFGMYIDHKWYKLTPKDGSFDEAHPVAHLDCSILNDLVLTPLLGIADAKTDSRIAYRGGEVSMNMVEQLVNSGRYDVGFTLYSVTMSQLKQVADTNNIMPPKSTWVEPKLRSGLVIYEF